jgi:MoaD family protein
LPRVKLKTFGILHRVTGAIERVIEVREGTTVYELLSSFFDKYPEVKRQLLVGESVSEDYRILLNGREVSYLPEGLKTKLRDGDEVAVIPPVGGGSGF